MKAALYVALIFCERLVFDGGLAVMTDTEEWDADLASIGSRDHLHAVGAFALYYNAAEMSLFGFFQRYAPGAPNVQAHLFGTMNNRQRIDFIKLMATDREGVEEASAIHHAASLFDICAENRNLVLHAIPGWEEEDGTLTFLKASAGKHGHLAVYAFTVDEIRAAARATAATEEYCMDLMRAVKARDGHNIFGPGGPPELPPRPPLPRKLSLSRRSEALRVNTPPPQSGRG